MSSPQVARDPPALFRGGELEPGSEASVGRVHLQLLTALGVFERHHADVRDGELGRIDHPDCNYLVAVAEHRHRPLPAARGKEIGDHDQQGSPLDELERVTKPARERGGSSGRRGCELGLEMPHEVEAAGPAGDRRKRPPDLRIEDNRAHPTSAAGDQRGGGGRHLERCLALQRQGRAPVERGAGIDDQPGVQSAIGMRLADEDAIRAGGQVPVDQPGVLAELVFPDIREFDARTP